MKPSSSPSSDGLRIERRREPEAKKCAWCGAVRAYRHPLYRFRLARRGQSPKIGWSRRVYDLQVCWEAARLLGEDI